MTAFTNFPYAVCGVSGRTGAATADALLRAGQGVRVVVRDAATARAWLARGAQVAVADLTDLAAMTAAFTDVQGAYVLAPQHYGREDLFALADGFAHTIARAGLAANVPRLVALSSVGADRDGATGWIGMNRMLEQHLASTGLPTIFLRAAYFLENWTPLIGHAIRTGTLPSFLAPADRRLPMVATADVGQAAADLLRETRMDKGVVTLAGPRDYAPDDVATVLAATLGRPINVAVLPESAWPDALAGAGFSQAALAGFTEMTRGLNNAHIMIDSDPQARAWRGATPLEPVVAGLVRQQR